MNGMHFDPIEEDRRRNAQEEAHFAAMDRAYQENEAREASLTQAYIDGRTDERESLSMAARDVLEERLRQTEEEGWTPEHDDTEHSHNHALSRAAVCYADVSGRMTQEQRDDIWPWDPKWWKPEDQRRSLVKAGALILAEIERLDRASARKAEGA